MKPKAKSKRKITKEAKSDTSQIIGKVFEKPDKKNKNEIIVQLQLTYGWSKQIVLRVSNDTKTLKENECHGTLLLSGKNDDNIKTLSVICPFNLDMINQKSTDKMDLNNN
ncbi:hypothetical protein SNEBB_008758 [Seison nebaliae]|nr:hypothetical protein SNEBB_008758 [Seison nebaliae]